MKNRGILLFTILLISSVFCGKLTPEEDEQRAKICGRVPENPDDRWARKEPWVGQTYLFDHSTRISTSFLISPRHLIANWKTILHHDKGGTGWEPIHNYNIWKFRKNGKLVDFKNCKDNVMFIPKEMHKEMIYRHIPVNWLQVNSVIYIGNCKQGTAPSGILLIEFDVPEDKKEEVPKIPICLAGKETKVKEGDQIQQQWSGTSDLKAYVKEEDDDGAKYTVTKCPSSSHDFSFCVKTHCKSWDGGIVQTKNGASVLLSMNIPYFSLKGCDKNEPDNGVSIAFFRDKICQYSGVCKETIGLKEDPNTSSRIFGLFDLLIFVLIFTFVSA